MKSILIYLLCVLVSFKSWAVDNKISQSQSIVVELHDESNKLGDDVSIRVQDLDSKKLAQITLKKQDDVTWDGFFLIQFFKGDTASRTLEFFAADKTPYFAYITTADKAQKVMLFTSSEDMTEFISKEADEKEKKVAKTVEVKPVTVAKPVQVMSPAKIAQVEKVVRQQVRTQEQAQVSIEEQQAKKRAELLALQEKMSQEQKQKKIAQATSLVKQADEMYSKGNYKEAEPLYGKATELDPENESYYYRYGVSLYKTENYNKSLATLSLAEVSDEKAIEKDYYIALNHLKLKDYDKSLKKFTEIRDENDPSLSPTASFFAGNIEFQQQKFSQARKSFEYVIDNSNDPKMDKAAEDMLDQVDRLENYYASKKEKYRFSFFVGPVYDQNVLNVAENNISTDVQAMRVNYGASALGIWYRTPTTDLGTKLAISDYYSTTTSFQSDATLQTADPLVFDFSVPFHTEFARKAGAVSLEVLPSYKSIYMSATGGTREEVINSTGLSTTVAAPLRGDLFLSGKIDVSSDKSLLASSTGDDDQSGLKYGLTVTPTFLLDLKGEKSISTDVSYLINNSEGINYKYNRWGVGVTYAFPFYWKSTATARLDYASQNYAEATTVRTDTTTNLTGTMSKDLNKQWNFTTTLQYTLANSDVELYKYNKLMVMGLFTYTLSVQSK